MGMTSNEARAGTIAAERVEEDIRCVECEHILRTLPLAGACPECGYSVDESVRAAGRWSRARITRLRMAAISFAIATVAWGGFAAVISGSATGGARAIAGTLVIIHLGAIVTAAFAALSSASLLPPKRRRLLLTVGAVGVVLASALPILLILGIGRTVITFGSAMAGLMLAASALRVLFGLAAGWWIIRGLDSLRPLWGMALPMRAILAIVLLAWLVFGFLFTLVSGLVDPLLGGPVAWITQNRAESIGFITLWGEVGGMLILATVGVFLAASLTRSPRRLGYASEN
jgi:hypothetical protein